MEKQKILICGAGSIGIYLGVKLELKGNEVYLFGRRKLKKAGDKVIIDNKEREVENRIFKLPKNKEFDIIFLTCKLYDMEKIVNLLKKNKIRAKIISNVQNGLVDLRSYEKKLGKKIIPICVFGGFRIDKNKILSCPTSIGWLTNNSFNGKLISSLVRKAEIPIKPLSLKKFNYFRVEKLIVNCCLNTLSAVEKKPFNELIANKKTFERIINLFNETYDILAKEYELKNKEVMRKEMIKNWKNVKHYSSTYQDVVSGRKTEVDFFNGFIVKIARKYGINAIENEKLLREMRNL